ncbi:Putative Ntf2 and rrm domain-containing protein [[Torrubiella] hemipterigena]|uniref:Putative Ntf2 and rrm domain-containing protein n=1 Tax=[Torrubiella] hemipterigena TaxID=1531966 RepID=A0A0A1T6M1_9HYPO|nr:Putative Ntf2 and rrm domain-containing protein [[Torrubiella] hemipterigena]
MATNGSFAQQDQLKAPANVDTNGTTNNNLSKDEVGWYFVEQYYTTLSKSPEKLHLFYGKRSQFVYGVEAEVANVSVGRQDIQDRIKALDFQDCKVRVSNVDSQASNESIVIQVIGETSNKGAEPKKFVQTFVLAQQPSGYFVLNDMLRYIDEETEEEETAAEPAAEPAATEAAAEEEAAPVEAAATEPEAPAAEEEAESAPVEVEAAAEPAVAVAEPAEKAAEEIKEVEKAAEPAAPAAKAEAPAEPAAPPKPMTWASRAAAAAGPRPVVPLAKTATPPAANQTRAPAPAAAAPVAKEAPAAAAAAAATEAKEATKEASKESSGWQTAGADSKRQKGAQPAATAVAEKDTTMGYVKYVTEKVQESELRAALAAHGELSYFDINRQKNCAFVEYKTIEGYQAAIASNPHTVNGENIVVEPRRPKAAGAGAANANGPNNRGNGASRGRGGFEGNRTNGGQGRGNFSGQTRGRGGAARGRGGANQGASA